jgi:hypothetical protein
LLFNLFLICSIRILYLRHANKPGTYNSVVLTLAALIQKSLHWSFNVFSHPWTRSLNNDVPFWGIAISLSILRIFEIHYCSGIQRRPSEDHKIYQLVYKWLNLLPLPFFNTCTCGCINRALLQFRFKFRHYVNEWIIITLFI